MVSKKLLSIVALILLASAILISNAVAADDPLKLPSPDTVVILEAVNGTQSYFNTTLSNVPGGYDVTNATYLGWCIDQSAEMTRSPATHQVNLYSSLSPPDYLADENWTMVNYILNHKPAGAEAQDIQEAIWYFINLNSGYSPQSSVALAIVNDAKANGTGFVPAENQIAAVIADPLYLTELNEVQISIIEVTVPQSGSEPTPTPPGTTPTPAPTSEPGSSPTPTPPQQEPGQTSPTPDGSEDSSGTIGNDALIAFGIILALVAIVVVVVLILRRRK